MIQIITDTASDITLAQAEEMGVTLLTLPVTFDGLVYDQMADVDFTKFYELLAQAKTLPVTSLSAPGDYLSLFEQAKENGDSVIAIPISSKLSGCYQSACLAKEMADYDDIHIVDAQQAIIGQRLMVEYAVRLRQEGVDAAEIAARVREASGRIRLFGALDTLKYLIKGGRVSKSVGIAGTALGIRPVVCLRDGVVCMAGKGRGKDGANAVLLKTLEENSAFDPAFPFCFGYTESDAQMLPFSRLVTETFGLENCRVYPVGSVVGTHLGPNATIIAWVVKP